MAGLKMPKRIEKIELEGIYEGFWIEAWINVPGFLFQEISRNFLSALPGEKTGDPLSSSSEDNRIIRAWNLTDFEGNDLEISNEVVRKKVSLELLRQFVDKYTQEAAGLKKISSGA